MPKRSIRTQLLAERKALSASFCLDSSLKIQQQLMRSEVFLGAATVALYSPVHNEVLTEKVAEKVLESGKALVYPRVKKNELEFVKVDSLDELLPGSFGVLEPGEGQVLPVAQIGLMVVPGVAFDHSGHRLGYGRGFYDRTLEKCRDACAKVGFAYEFQLLEALPAAAHDERLSVLITENRTMTFAA